VAGVWDFISEPQGDWVGVYGGDGYVLANWNGGSDLVSLPAGASLALLNASRGTWAASTSDVRALQDPTASTRKAAFWANSGGALRAQLTFANGYEGWLHVYVIDWDTTTRRQDVAYNNDNLFPRTRRLRLDKSFAAGAWVSAWCRANPGSTLSVGPDYLAGANAVMSGLFLGGEPTIGPGRVAEGTGTRLRVVTSLVNPQTLTQYDPHSEAQLTDYGKPQALPRASDQFGLDGLTEGIRYHPGRGTLFFHESSETFEVRLDGHVVRSWPPTPYGVGGRGTGQPFDPVLYGLDFTPDGTAMWRNEFEAGIIDLMRLDDSVRLATIAGPLAPGYTVARLGCRPTDGHMFVGGNNVVEHYDAAGTLIRTVNLGIPSGELGTGGFGWPVGFAWDGANRLWMTVRHGRIITIDPNDTLLSNAILEGTNPTAHQYQEIRYDAPSDSLYVTDTSGARLVNFSLDRVVLNDYDDVPGSWFDFVQARPGAGLPIRYRQRDDNLRRGPRNNPRSGQASLRRGPRNVYW
jgi:hypothetical protein